MVLSGARWSSDPRLEAPDGCADLARHDQPVDDAEVYPDGWFVPRIPHGLEQHALVNRSAGARELVAGEIARLAGRLRLDSAEYVGGRRSAWMEVTGIEQLDAWNPPAAVGP